MSMLNLTLPQSLQERVETLAVQEGISVNDFIMLAVAEKTAALTTVTYLAERGSREKLLSVLAKAPNVEPEEHDKL